MNANNIPAGFVLVPREPTFEMYLAACRAFTDWSCQCDLERDGEAPFTKGTFTHCDTYRAMLAAAPTQGAEGAAPQAVVGEASEPDGDPISKAQYRRMFGAACEALGMVNESLGLDPDDGGAEPILAAIAELKAAPTPTAPQEADALREALKDTERLNWLESSGEGTVEIFRFKLFDYEALKYEQGFVINKGKAETSLREAIDAARAALAQHQPQQGEGA